MKKRKIIILSSIISIVVCLTIVLGFTFAIFTNTTRVSVGLHSGAIQLDAYITNFELYSAKKYSGANSTSNEILTDTNGDTYIYEKQSNQFVNGGSASINNNVLTFKNLCPGDRVDFDIELLNVGEIALQYNAIIALTDQVENILFNAMDIKMSIIDHGSTELSPFRTGPSSLHSEWVELGIKEESKVHISFALPITANNLYQETEAKFKCTLSAIQNLGDNNSLANIFDSEGNPVLTEDGLPIIVTSLKDAVEFTPNGGVIDIIRGSESANQNITIDKSIVIQSSDSEFKSFSNVHITVTRGGALELKNICFKEDSYIDISTATLLSIDHCIFDINPSRLFDESTREYLQYASGIVSTGIQKAGIQLICKNSSFSTTNPDSVVLYMQSSLTSDSIIENNTFGNATFEYENTALILNGVVQDTDFAMIELNNNKFYLGDSACAISLQKNIDSIYYLNSQSNKLIGGSALVSMDSNFAVIVFDNGSTIAERALTLSELGATETTIFTAINAIINEDRKFVAGTFKLGNELSEEEFRNTFLYKLALDHNIIIVE